jgi:acetoacetate decarboxylase
VKQEDVLKQLTTPIGAPAFPRGPFRFNNREYLNILYRTDIDALRAVVSELDLVPHALAPMADFPVREIVSCSHIMTDLTLARARRCYNDLDNVR